MIALDGTIPINYRRAYYHIPVCIYLRKDHPETPPICYVRPTSQMTIKESKNVDSQGKVFVPYLSNWHSSRSDLSSLIQVMSMAFSETPPVYKKPEASMQQSPSNSSMQSRAGFQSRSPFRSSCPAQTASSTANRCLLFFLRPERQSGWPIQLWRLQPKPLDLSELRFEQQPIFTVELEFEHDFRGAHSSIAANCRR